MNLSAFKAYDIRGLYPDEINEELAYLVGRATVRYLSAKTIVVGRDMRLSSPSLSAKLIEGINCEGADVINIGLCTTPMLYFAVAHYGYDGGIMVSASHNPGDNNAFKVVRKGAEMLDETMGLKEIRNLVQRGFGQCAIGGAVTEKEVLTDYVSHVLEYAKEISDLRVVLDYGNGVGALSAKPILARLDIDAIGLFEDPDGNFPNHPANPHDEANFKDLSERVKKEKADLGIFFDGDADRALFVDENGKLVMADLLAALLAKEELKVKGGGKVYFDLRFTKAFPGAIKSEGGEPVMLRVGNPFYKRALREGGGVLGAEFSGHVMFPDNYSIDDGLFCAIKVLDLISKSKKSLSELIQGVSVFESSPEVSVVAKHPETVFDRLISKFPDGKIIELDGIYLDFPDGFISVRQSQNELQLFRIRAEAKTKEELKKRFLGAKKVVLG